MKKKYKSQEERTFIAIRKKAKKVFNDKALKSKIKRIDYIEKLIYEAK